MLAFVFLAFQLLAAQALECRTHPRDVALSNWNTLNASTSGRLVSVVPSAQFCKNRGNCTDAEWASAVFRATIPGAMDAVNWEQNYDIQPPEVCLRNTVGDCKQGKVPLYAILARDEKDVQKGVLFAKKHNLRLVVKASGHDSLGRSTAPNSLLISTHLLQDITFHEKFFVGGSDLGSCVTVGSGVPLNKLYQAAKAQNMIVVAGYAATVVAAGGYIQGAGHSALGPLLGMAADNVLQFTIVTGQGKVLLADEIQNQDLYWALRGGGAGSWGVIISATFRTHPTFNATFSDILIVANDSATLGRIMTSHANHIFELDRFWAGQYIFMLRDELTNSIQILVVTFIPHATAEEAQAAMKSFVSDAVRLGGTPVHEIYEEKNINDTLTTTDDAAGSNLFIGSRFIPESTYTSPDAIGAMYEQLIDAETLQIVACLVAGGKVTENADIDSAVHPRWRTAKTHVIVANSWPDDTSAGDVLKQRDLFQTRQLPLIEALVGTAEGSYANEGDSREPNFETTFFGPNYERLGKVKAKYDPDDLFIVIAGVGSERWDADGLCRVE